MAAQTYPIDTIAKLLDLTPRRVQQLSGEGVIPKAERGRYELVPAVQGYIKYLRDRAINADVGGDRLVEHRTRLTKARADLAEMEREQLSGELIPAKDVEDAWAAMVANMRARLLSIPGKAAPQSFAAENVTEAKAVIKEQIFEALAELSAIEVKVVNPIRASDAGDIGVEDDEIGGAATGPDSQPMGGPEPQAIA